MLYLKGAIAASGSIPLGGDHITNDIHLVTHIPLSRAEDLKKTDGDASGDPARGIGKVVVYDDHGLAEAEIERSLLNDIINGRVEEMFDLVLDRLPEGCLCGVGTGVFLTGGTSRLRGISELANDMFDLPIYQSEQSNISGVHANFRDPQYSTAVGLIRYAQILDAEREASTGGTVSRVLKSIWPFR